MSYNFHRPDYCGAAGAHHLAESLTQYWRDKGYDVSFRVETCTHPHTGAALPTYCVRSDMVGGWPTRRADNNAR